MPTTGPEGTHGTWCYLPDPGTSLAPYTSHGIPRYPRGLLGTLRHLRGREAPSGLCSIRGTAGYPRGQQTPHGSPRAPPEADSGPDLGRKG